MKHYSPTGRRNHGRLWRDFWIRETGTGQQLAQLHERYMMMMIIRTKLISLSVVQMKYKRNRIQHVNRMPRNRLPRVMKHYSPTGRRNHGRPLKRLMGTWDRNGSTSWPTPWKINHDDDDDGKDLLFWMFVFKILRNAAKTIICLGCLSFQIKESSLSCQPYHLYHNKTAFVQTLRCNRINFRHVKKCLL